MNRSGALVLMLLGMVTAGAVTGGAEPAATRTPAAWRSYDMLVEFRALPRAYACDELWYKVRDVLLQLGARAYMTITPYDCGAQSGAKARSPSVEVKFQLPQPLAGPATRYAETTVSERAIRLAPGSPGSLQARDCELMRQLQETLLAGLPVRVAGASFSCTAAAKTFALTVDAPIAAHGSATPRS